MNKPSTKTTLLSEAEQLIHGPRQADYGDTLVNFAQIAMLWQGTLAMKLAPGQRITPEDVILCMMQVKIARLAKSLDHRDSTLDIAGYAGCIDELQNERKAGIQLPGTIIDSRAE